MSVESAKKFLEKFNSDEAFKKEIEGLGGDDARKEFVKKAGFEFTKEDLKAVAKSSGKQELGEEDLESVAGGSSATWAGVGAGGAGAAAAAL